MTPEQYDALLRKEDVDAAAMIKDELLKGQRGGEGDWRGRESRNKRHLDGPL